MWPGVGQSSEAVFLLRDMPALPRGRGHGADEPDRSCAFVCLSASLVAAENGSESPNVGGAQKRGDIQRAPGELRQLDEHQPARGDLHVQGRGQILADA